MPLVWTLSALPINGPALIYVKKPVSGTIMTLLEAAGLSLGTWGAVTWASENDCIPGSDKFLCNLGDLAFGAIVVGSYGLLWFGPYLSTLFRAPSVASEYNNSLKTSQLTVTPYIRTSADTNLFGLTYHF